MASTSRFLGSILILAIEKYERIHRDRYFILAVIFNEGRLDIFMKVNGQDSLLLFLCQKK
jgi:hypothetical protein